MKKTYKLENLDCANCANQIEEALGGLEGIESVSVNFFTEKLKIQAETIDQDLLDRVQDTISKIERHTKIVY